MGGTREGGLKAAAKIKAKDPDFYHTIGGIGGRNGNTGGFAGNPELAAELGRIGGKTSRRKKRATIKDEAPTKKKHKIKHYA